MSGPKHHDHDSHDGDHRSGDHCGPEYFDEAAATWDDAAKVERSQVVAEVLGQTLPLGPSTRVLEYGAGTGLVTQALAELVGSVTLVEPSGGMREVVASKVAAGRLPAEARVWDLDLTRDDPPDERFDLIVTVLVLHHIPELGRVLEGFAALLDDGGHLAVVDLEQEDGSFHGEGFGGHHGFARVDLEQQLVAAGFAEVAFRPCHHVVRDTGTYPLFLATATRPTRS
jgi:predicted TPR repeat methyltransferase